MEIQAQKAVVLLSGGLDSATVLSMAQAQGFDCYALSFNYSQRSTSELHAAARVARAAGVPHRVMEIDLSLFGGSALTDTTIDVPQDTTSGIPVTYVPARNTVFFVAGAGLGGGFRCAGHFYRRERRRLFWLSRLSPGIYQRISSNGKLGHACGG